MHGLIVTEVFVMLFRTSHFSSFLRNTGMFLLPSFGFCHQCHGLHLRRNSTAGPSSSQQFYLFFSEKSLHLWSQNWRQISASLTSMSLLAFWYQMYPVIGYLWLRSDESQYCSRAMYRCYYLRSQLMAKVAGMLPGRWTIFASGLASGKASSTCLYSKWGPAKLLLATMMSTGCFLSFPEIFFFFYKID